MKENQKSRYQIREIIKENVYLSDDSLTDRPVILKISEENRQSELPSHPLVCRNTDVFVSEGKTVRVFEYIPGRTLKQIMEDRVFSVAEAAELMIPAAELIQELYEAGWLCCDLKPSNLILGEDGRVHLIDTESLFRIDEALLGARYATKGYAAPEQFGRNARADIRSSVFSLGSILYEMLSGQALMNQDYVILPFRIVRASLAGTEAEKLVAECLKTDPAERLSQPKELVRRLKEMTER